MQVLAPLDALRRDAIAALLARPRLGAWLTRRDRRIAIAATLGVIVALAVASVLPAAALVLAPIVLGVPHVASDARYLVIRRRVPRAIVVVLAVACATMLALRVVEGLVADPTGIGALEVGLGVAWAGAFCVAGAVASRAWGRLAVALPVVAITGALALRDPDLTRVIFAHAHNLVAVVVWVVLFRRARLAAIPALIALGVAIAIAMSGAPLALAQRLGTDHALGMSMADAASMLAPGVGARVAMGLTASYVLLQSIHYAVWLGWIPQDDVRGEGTLTFAMTARGLRRDFGVFGLAAIGLTWLTVIAGALVDARGARDTYLSLAAFHAYLELAMLGYLCCAVTGVKLPIAGERQDLAVSSAAA